MFYYHFIFFLDMIVSCIAEILYLCNRFEFTKMENFLNLQNKIVSQNG